MLNYNQPTINIKTIHRIATCMRLLWFAIFLAIIPFASSYSSSNVVFILFITSYPLCSILFIVFLLKPAVNFLKNKFDIHIYKEKDVTNGITRYARNDLIVLYFKDDKLHNIEEPAVYGFHTSEWWFKGIRMDSVGMTRSEVKNLIALKIKLNKF